jgi:plastocyanin
VVAADGSFESPGLDVGESFTHTFAKPGTFRYSIREHPSATGTITVE